MVTQTNTVKQILSAQQKSRIAELEKLISNIDNRITATNQIVDKRTQEYDAASKDLLIAQKTLELKKLKNQNINIKMVN